VRASEGENFNKEMRSSEMIKAGIRKVIELSTQPVSYPRSHFRLAGHMFPNRLPLLSQLGSLTPSVALDCNCLIPILVSIETINENSFSWPGLQSVFVDIERTLWE